MKWVAIGGVLSFALLFLITPNQAEAGIFDFGYYILGKIALGISYIVSWIAALAIAILAWFIEIILRLNTNIINSAPVRFGFPIALSIANLGFVLAIIIIAIATILRLESYAMKQILWKLVVAALLVNFSLVFAGAILNLADQLTLYFVNQMSPGGVGETQRFANAIAGAFNPQQLVMLTESNLNPSKVQDFKSKVDESGGSFAVDNESLGKMLVPVASLVFTGISMIMIVITLLGLVIMLLIRYVFLGILLILMPLAWLAWIFPALKDNWGKWWKNFWRWTFFAPLVVLFLYIGVQAAAQLPGQIGPYSAASQTSGTGPWAAIVGSLSSLMATIVPSILQQFVIIGIMVGGLFAANSLGISGAKGMMGMASKLSGKWAGGMAAAPGGIARKTAGVAARYATGAGPRLTQPPPVTGVGSGIKHAYHRWVGNPVKKAAWWATTPARKPLQKGVEATLGSLGKTGYKAYGALVDYGLKQGETSLTQTIMAGAEKRAGIFDKILKLKTKTMTPKEIEETYHVHVAHEEEEGHGGGSGGGRVWGSGGRLSGGGHS